MPVRGAHFFPRRRTRAVEPGPLDQALLQQGFANYFAFGVQAVPHKAAISLNQLVNYANIRIGAHGYYLHYLRRGL